jgi:hypothetical protein
MRKPKTAREERKQEERVSCSRRKGKTTTKGQQEDNAQTIGIASRHVKPRAIMEEPRDHC